MENSKSKHKGNRFVSIKHPIACLRLVLDIQRQPAQTTFSSLSSLHNLCCLFLKVVYSSHSLTKLYIYSVLYPFLIVCNYPFNPINRQWFHMKKIVSPTSSEKGSTSCHGLELSPICMPTNNFALNILQLLKDRRSWLLFFQKISKV